MSNQKPSFRFEIDNFSKKEAAISSETFLCEGCEWYLKVYPKGNRSAENYLSLYLYVANPKSLRNGWERSAKQHFVVLNQSDKEVFRSSPKNNLFHTENPSWGFRKALPLSTLQEEGVLENDKLIIEVYIEVVEVVDGEVLEKKENVEINGFQVLASQVTSARKLFAEHPDIAEDLKPKNKAVKAAYMNVLLNLIKKIEEPPKSLSETKLTKASSKLSELMDVGFKLGWLKSKLDEISLVKKKLDDDVSRVQKLEERIKNIELMETGFRLESVKTKLDKLSLERKKADADGSLFQQLDKRVKNHELNETGFRVEYLETELEDLKKELDEFSSEKTKENSQAQQLEEAMDDYSWSEKIEERVKNLELNETGFKVEHLKTELDELKTELDEVSLERTKENSRAEQLEERLKNLEVMELGVKLESLTTKIDEVTLEVNKSDEDEESWAEQLEERVKNLEMMELGFKLESLKTELDEISLERKKENSQVQQIEERLKSLEAMELGIKVDSLETKLDEVSLDRNKSDDDSWAEEVEELEERVKNFEVMELQYKLDCVNRKLEEVTLKMNNSDYHHGSRVKQLEESIKKLGMMDLGFKMDCLNTKLEEVSLEKKKSHDADELRIQQVEDSVNDIRLMFSYLKAQVDKKKDKSSSDGFLLVD